MQQVRVKARDGYPLGATLFHPQVPQRRAIVIHAAAGVPQSYYAGFASFLAECGFTVLTFDYRGIGSSRPDALRGFGATMREWAVLDAAGALDFLESEAPGVPIGVVGHSFGGQCLGIVPGNERYAAVLAVASQSGYWCYWSGGARVGMWLATHLVLPGLSRLVGYFPARRLGQGEDLPAGVAIEWARWCRNPDYIVGALAAHPQYARFQAPMRLVWLADDRYAPLAAAKALLSLYPAAQTELCEVQPADLGERNIGHFGFFRERFRATLWTDAANWLTEKF